MNGHAPYMRLSRVALIASPRPPGYELEARYDSEVTDCDRDCTYEIDTLQVIYRSSPLFTPLRIKDTRTEPMH